MSQVSEIKKVILECSEVDRFNGWNMDVVENSFLNLALGKQVIER